MSETLFTSNGQTSVFNVQGNSNQTINLNLTDSSNSGSSATVAIPHVGSTTVWGGGGTSHAFTITGLPAGAIVVPAIESQANTAYIVKWVVTANTLTVTFSADPGAGTQLTYTWSAQAQ